MCIGDASAFGEGQSCLAVLRHGLGIKQHLLLPNAVTWTLAIALH